MSDVHELHQRPFSGVTSTPEMINRWTPSHFARLDASTVPTEPAQLHDSTEAALAPFQPCHETAACLLRTRSLRRLRRTASTAPHPSATAGDAPGFNRVPARMSCTRCARTRRSAPPRRLATSGCGSGHRALRPESADGSSDLRLTSPGLSRGPSVRTDRAVGFRSLPEPRQSCGPSRRYHGRR